jgi:hypothetical protein
MTKLAWQGQRSKPREGWRETVDDDVEKFPLAASRSVRSSSQFDQELGAELVTDMNHPRP